MPGKTRDFNLPYPYPSEQVREGANSIRLLAEAVARELEKVQPPAVETYQPLTVEQGYIFYQRAGRIVQLDIDGALGSVSALPEGFRPSGRNLVFAVPHRDGTGSGKVSVGKNGFVGITSSKKISGTLNFIAE